MEPLDAAGLFARHYGREPEGVWFAPGRVNLMGGPDYTETFVLPVTLGTGVCAAASRRGDGRLSLVSRQASGEPVVLFVDTLEPGSVDGWAAYPAGVAWALREAGYLRGGADVAVDADLPAGAGLSSSAALECAVALALTELYEVPVPRRELAALARRAENVFAGVPTGIMDQIAALLGRAGHALLLDCRAGTAEPVPFDPAAAGLTLLIIDTGVRHALGDGRYAERRQACEQGAAALGVRSLRDVSSVEEAMSGLHDPVLRRRARHVITENERVLQAVDLMRRGDLGGVGQLLSASHASLANDFEISWPEADATVDAAVGAGALGARMMGGGFGGSVIALVDQDAAPVRAAVGAAYDRQGWPAPGFLDAPPSEGAHRLSQSP